MELTREYALKHFGDAVFVDDGKEYVYDSTRFDNYGTDGMAVATDAVEIGQVIDDDDVKVYRVCELIDKKTLVVPKRENPAGDAWDDEFDIDSGYIVA